MRNSTLTSPSGGCLCGQVRYVLVSPPTKTSDCHCRDCRHSSGAAYTTWGLIRREDFILESGEIREVAFEGRLRNFAACCGTALLYQASAETDRLGITICSLDHPENFPTTHAIWLDDRLPWVHIDPNLRAYAQDDEEVD
jgi:hypothetical protein